MLFKGYPLVRTTIRQFTHTARSLAQTGAISSPARAVLYVPGSDVKKLAKIFASPADCVVMDCEDGVALSRKDEARNNIRALFDTDERVQNDTDGKFAVRINPAHTEFAVQDIAKLFNFKKEALATKKPTQLLPKCVFVPKTNHPDDIRWLYEKLETKLNGLDHALNLYFYMESAMSLINLNEIIKSALAASTDRYNDRYKLEGFVFGSDDFCADISATRTKEADELAYARQKLVTHCKAYKLKVIDMVYIDFKGER
jgi:citrate lyase beta subunit